MVAAVAIVNGPAPGMADIARMAQDAIEEWLRGYEGYRGLLVFTDEPGQRARIITLWETAESEARSRRGRTAMRDQVAATAGMAVEGMEIYEVPVCELHPTT